MANVRKYDGMPLYTICGIPEYMSPEMVTGQGYDFLTDIWSFGILLFELLTGSTPFENYVQEGNEKLLRVIGKVTCQRAHP